MEKRGKGILSCLAIALPAWLLGQQFRWWEGLSSPFCWGWSLPWYGRTRGRRRRESSGPARSCSRQRWCSWGSDWISIWWQLPGNSPCPLSCPPSPPLWCCPMYPPADGHSHEDFHLVGVGSSICGGSAIAAAAPAIRADDEEVAQAISVIFFFNVLAAVLFPLLGRPWDSAPSAEKVSGSLLVQR